jgi:N-acetylglucosamine-6-phosphate deacetylase
MPVSAKASAPGDLTIAAARLFDGQAFLENKRVHIRAGIIEAVAPDVGAAPPGDFVRLQPDVTLAPGLIDLQVNGGGGVLLNDDVSLAAIRTIAETHQRLGVTGLLPTLISDSPDRLEQLATIAAEAMAIPGVLGFHLEGPHLNPQRRGIHAERHVRPMTSADIALLARFGGIGRSLVTVAPEGLPEGAVQALTQAGLRVSVGHSDATAPHMRQAIDAGATGVTHLFNAMAQMTPREPGVVGMALADDRLFAGIIADGLHVAPDNLRVAWKAMGAARLMLVSDAMPLVGTDRTSFMLQGRAITLREGRLTDEAGVLAGAHLDMLSAVRNAVRLAGIPPGDALRMASGTPAAFLGLGRRMGAVQPGFQADLIAIDGDYQLKAVWMQGRRL